METPPPNEESRREAGTSEDYGLHLESGDRHYRAWVGPPEDYDLIAALQVSLLFAAGLRETHRFCDVGCGSLRAGRMLIPYLRPSHYHGIEPEQWLVEAGVEKELGRDALELKRPKFRYVSDFSLEGFGTEFDFVVAQSVFSHTEPDLLRLGFGKIAASLAQEGLLFATWARGKSRRKGSGWIRKGVRRCTWKEIEEYANECGLTVRRINWPHPRQNWFVGARAGSSAERTIDELSQTIRPARKPERVL